MKNLIILAGLLVGFYFTAEVKAQSCPPCPEMFQLSDSGCTRITIFRSPNGYTASDSIRACKNSQVTYTLTANVNGCNYPGINFTYNIVNGTLVSSTTNQITVLWGSSGTGAINVNFTYNNQGIRCDGIFTVAATLVDAPVAAFSISPNPACFNNPTTINFNSNATTGATNYFWDFGDGFQATGPNPTHNYTAPGSYTVTLIASTPTNTGGAGTNQVCPSCVDSVKGVVVINALPGPPIECVATVCAGEVATYCTSASGCSMYQWTVTGGTIVSGQNTSCIQVLWGSGNPQGTINLVATGCATTYCSQGTTVTVPIVPAATTVNGNTNVCLNTTSNYSLPTWPGTTYNWNVSGGGNIVGFNTNTSSININWTTPGTWTVTSNYFDSSKNCGGTATTTVTVLPSAKITGPQKFCAGQSITLNASNQFNVPLSATWTVTPGATIVGSNVGTSVTITSATAGSYLVTANTGTAACNSPTYIITVLPQPIVAPVQGVDSICAGQTYVYSTSSNTPGFFNWIVNNGTPVFMGSFFDSVQVTWGNTGPYSLSVSQISSGTNCISNTQTFNAYAYPTPNITGPTAACADAVVTYTVNNIGNQPFNWFITPSNLGTVISGQGTNQVQIKWHGSTNPGSSNVVYLHYALCTDDSIAITITEPVLPVMTVSGNLCQAGGVSLNPNSTGSSYSWTSIPAGYSSTNNVATGITNPGVYSLVITDYNGSGCTVTGTYNVADVGRPVASISADDVLNYCLPDVPNMNLVAASGAGYSYAWYQGTNTSVGSNSAVLPINNLTATGTYTFYAVVTLNGCSDTSNVITITIQNCQPVPGCSGDLIVSNITGCNPFTLTLTSPQGTVVSGTTTITYQNAPPTSGNTTIVFDSVGYKQITVCADIALTAGGTTRCCKDTVVLVKLASKFLSNVNCAVVNLTDLSTVISPCSINAYSWSVGSFPGNNVLPAGVASFNNSTIASPVLTFTQSGQYIITQTITGCGCTSFSRDTVTISVPNAAFTVSNSCVGTPVVLNPSSIFTSHFWDFGDFATSYSANTTHAYGAPGNYLITHTVTDAGGCTNTVTNNILINPKSSCVISYSGATTFCFGQQLVLNACSGYSNYQWFNNGVAVANGNQFIATQTGNYSFSALTNDGCVVSSDTVSVIVNPAPPSGITANNVRCLGGVFVMSVPGCNTCTFVWTDNNVVLPSQTSNQANINVNPAVIGSHVYGVTVTNNLTGCSSSSTINITFNNPPSVSIAVSGNPTQLCSGNSYLLTASSNAANPSWAWMYTNLVIANTTTLNASAAGSYSLTVTDGITGCSSSASQTIQPSPNLSLFPVGCDSLCDTSTVFIPLPSNNGNLAGYTITWYNNAPPFTNVVGSGPSINVAGLPLGNNSLSVIVTSANGCVDTTNNYNILVTPCGEVDCTCEGSTWDSLYWAPIIDNGKMHATESNGDASSAIIIVPPAAGTAIECGKSIGVFDCRKPIMIYASFACNPSGCDSSVTYQLSGPVTATGVMPFSTAGLPAGNYVLTITGVCGNVICSTCKIPFTITCNTEVDCCKESYWKDGPFWVDPETKTKKKINCKSDKVQFEINTSSKNCFNPITIQGNWVCADECESKVVYELYDAANTLVMTSIGSLAIPPSLANGIYTIKVLAYCGGKLCDTCTFKFRKDCKCDCPPKNEITAVVSTVKKSTKYECGEKLPVFDCDDNSVLSATYNCNPSSCPSALSYQLTGPGGTTTGTLPLAINTLAPGNYSITIFAYCNGKLCKQCKFSFKVKCEKPPVKCCQDVIVVKPGETTFDIFAPSNNAVIANQPYYFTGLAGKPMTEVRAEVVSYNLSSNFNNECLDCTSFPFTWSSIATAGNIGSVTPKITMFGGATTSVFIPTGSGVYKNPREVIWSSSTPFILSGPVNIKFYLPPIPAIDCCVLKGTVCVKFTFRDDKCNECSVLVCFDFEIGENENGIFAVR